MFQWKDLTAPEWGWTDIAMEGIAKQLFRWFAPLPAEFMYDETLSHLQNGKSLKVAPFAEYRPYPQKEIADEV